MSDQPRETLLRPLGAISLADLADVWRYRELTWTLAMRDVRVRYKQAALGAAWALLQPLVQMVVFSLLFNRVAGIGSGSAVPYPPFCFAGLIVWMLFSVGWSHASESLTGNPQLITKVYFPRVVLVFASVLTAVVDFVVAFALLLVLIIGFGLPLHASIVAAPLVAALAAAGAVAAGLWTSAINLQFRDVRHALPFFIQLMIYMTPVFYPASILPARWRPFLALNPMSAVVTAFRATLFGEPLPWRALALATATIVAVGATGFLYFRRMEQTFADRI